MQSNNLIHDDSGKNANEMDRIKIAKRYFKNG